MCTVKKKIYRQQDVMPHIMKSAGQFGRETSQIIADTETDGDFTPAWEKKWLFNIKRQQITLKPAGQTQKGVMDLGKQPDLRAEVLGETVKDTEKERHLYILCFKDLCIMIISFACSGK